MGLYQVLLIQSVYYFFVAITPRSTLTKNGSTF